MDPNANLQEQRRLAASLISADENDEFDDGHERDAARLAELVIALDEWITKGGFLPKEWERK